MGCKKCNKGRCGCKDSAQSIPASFNNCPDPCESRETCTEIFDMHCICYQGEDIVEYDIKKGDRLDEIMQKVLLVLSNPTCSSFDDITTCQSPINLTVSNITSQSFSLAWDPTPIATGYIVEYKESSSNTWLLNPIVNAPTTNDTVIGLLPEKVYDIRVNAICPSSTCYSLNIRIATLAATN